MGFYIGFGLANLLQIYCPCFFCNQVEYHSSKLVQDSYDGDWSSASLDFVILRNFLRPPQKIVALQLFSIDLDAFQTVNNSEI
jgi:hypothetical protein